MHPCRTQSVTSKDGTAALWHTHTRRTRVGGGGPAGGSNACASLRPARRSPSSLCWGTKPEARPACASVRALPGQRGARRPLRPRGLCCPADSVDCQAGAAAPQGEWGNGHRVPRSALAMMCSAAAACGRAGRWTDEGSERLGHTLVPRCKGGSCVCSWDTCLRSGPKTRGNVSDQLPVTLGYLLYPVTRQQCLYLFYVLVA